VSEQNKMNKKMIKNDETLKLNPNESIIIIFLILLKVVIFLF